MKPPDRKNAEQPEPKPAESAEPPAGGFRFHRFIVRKVAFEEMERLTPADGEKRPRTVGMELTIGAGIQMNPSEMRAIVTLDVEVRPDPKWQPYDIAVKASGFFSGHNVSVEQFESFCRNGVPAILFPYFREIVHGLTRDAAHGLVRIEPINIGELVRKANWGEPQETPSAASTEPEPPS
jgi:preprotein translocase subunit SecB